MYEIIVSIISTLISAGGLFTAIHYRNKAIEGEKWSTVNSRIQFVQEQVNEMEQLIQRNTDRISVVERDTEKLETSVEKKLDHVSAQIEKLQQLIYEIVKDKNG